MDELEEIVKEVTDYYNELYPNYEEINDYSKFSGYETKQIILVETRGLASSKYENVFKKICAYAKQYVEANKDGSLVSAYSLCNIRYRNGNTLAKYYSNLN